MGGLRHVVVLVLAMCWLGCGFAHAEVCSPRHRQFSLQECPKPNDRDAKGSQGIWSAIPRHADVAVIYCAGHSIELDGINYLIPTPEKRYRRSGRNLSHRTCPVCRRGPLSVICG